MAEYIEREALEVALNHRLSFLMAEYDEYEHYTCGYREAVDTVENFPSVDAVPVVHGQWIIGVDDDDFDVKCSKCGWTDIFEVAGIAAAERIAKTMHYCPNCGAKMDGGVNDADSRDAVQTM